MKNLIQCSFTQMSPERGQNIVSKQGTGQTNSIGPDMVNFTMPENDDQRTHKVTMLLPTFKGLFENQCDKHLGNRQHAYPNSKIQGSQNRCFQFIFQLIEYHSLYSMINTK